MSSAFFQFKHFTVYHDRCAMKVGTDGVLLGAWAPASQGHILDIGTGSGLIALMLAQRCQKARIDGIDIDDRAVEQARINFAASPWKERLQSLNIAVQNLSKQPQRYDLIVSNPPYFIDSLKNPDVQRQIARHTDTLSYKELVEAATTLLTPQGDLALILPAESKAIICETLQEARLHINLLTNVYSKQGKPKKRILLTASKVDKGFEENDFYIQSETSPRSEQYTDLTRDFYL